MKQNYNEALYLKRTALNPPNEQLQRGTCSEQNCDILLLNNSCASTATLV